METYLRLLLTSFIILLSACEKKLSDSELRIKAKELAHTFTIIDTHIDAPIKLYHQWKDIADSTDRNFDYYKARKGGLNIPFMSIFVPASTEGSDKSTIMADSLINLTENTVKIILINLR